MGTPITGRMVLAAMTPARWAARPAAAMMTSRPRSSASLAYSWACSGARWALMTLDSNGTPKRSRMKFAACIFGWSELEPITIPTSGSPSSSAFVTPHPLSRFPAPIRARFRPRPGPGADVRPVPHAIERNSGKPIVCPAARQPGSVTEGGHREHPATRRHDRSVRSRPRTGVEDRQAGDGLGAGEAGDGSAGGGRAGVAGGGGHHGHARLGPPVEAHLRQGALRAGEDRL